MSDSSELRPRLRWPSLFQECTAPLFILNRSNRLRFVNAAWEKLTGENSADVLGKACLRKGPTETLYRTLAPPSELTRKSMAIVRRPVPPHKNGPPWWDVTFLKLTDTEGHTGYLGVIDAIVPAAGETTKTISLFIGSLRKKHSEQFGFDLFAGSTIVAEQFLARLKHAANDTSPVWIHGEAGSGKETSARVIHHNGIAQNRPFVKIDCVALQPYLIEAILFGTGGLSSHIGTLFLKNPAAMPRDLQRKLSDWLLNDASAPRLISSSRNSAALDVAAGSLRPEFATQLSVIEISPLPLRKRFDELPRCVERIVSGSTPYSDNIHRVLMAHRWPGNLRELRDALRLAGTPLLLENLPRYLREKTLAPETSPKVPRPSLDAILEAVEKKLITHAIEESQGNQTDAAQRLGIFRARLIRRIDALGLAME